MFLPGRRLEPVPAAPPPRGDLLALTGTGLDGAETAATATVTITLGDRTFTTEAVRRGCEGFPVEYAFQAFEEVTARREPEPVPTAADEPEPSHVPVDPEREIAVVRRPITDRDGAVVGYELLVDSPFSPNGSRATAGIFLDAFADVGLERLAGRHRAWVPVAPAFLMQVGTPPVRPDRVVLQLAATPVAGEVLEVLRKLQWTGYRLALDGYDGSPDLAPLVSVCGIVKVPIADRTDAELRAVLAEPARAGVELVATDVATPQEFDRARRLGFTAFQGQFFAQPNLTRQRRVGTGGIASLQALAAVVAPDASFEDLERAISADVGLSLKLLRYVNSAFFSLPRTVESVREALSLLGTDTVRRWSMVVALAAAGDAPEELVELALQRARMCEVLSGNPALDAGDAHFTVGLFSVADALLDQPMEEVLDTLPFSEEIRAALLRREGPKGELLHTVVAYEQGEFPADDGRLANAYGDAVAWAGDAAGDVT